MKNVKNFKTVKEKIAKILQYGEKFIGYKAKYVKSQKPIIVNCISL